MRTHLTFKCCLCAILICEMSSEDIYEPFIWGIIIPYIITYHEVHTIRYIPSTLTHGQAESRENVA